MRTFGYVMMLLGIAIGPIVIWVTSDFTQDILTLLVRIAGCSASFAILIAGAALVAGTEETPSEPHSGDN